MGRGGGGAEAAASIKQCTVPTHKQRNIWTAKHMETYFKLSGNAYMKTLRMLLV